MSDAELLQNFKEQYIENKRVQQIMLALRQVSSEKFAHAHMLLNLQKTDEQEI
jgi:hypothetical protein